MSVLESWARGLSLYLILGGSGLRMKELVDGGAEPPVQSSKLESEKDKGKRPASDTHLGKDGEGTSGSNKENKVNGLNIRAGKCFPKSKMIPKIQIKSDRIKEDITNMKEHALIGKFVGIWPMEKTLVWWINTTWKPQGHYDLTLRSKGFFMVIFFNKEDRT